MIGAAAKMRVAQTGGLDWRPWPAGLGQGRFIGLAQARRGAAGPGGVQGGVSIRGGCSGVPWLAVFAGAVGCRGSPD